MMSDESEQGRELVAQHGFGEVMASQQSRAVFLPANLGQAMELAHFMAGGIGVRQWMRGNPSACLALIQISMRWGMDPYIVANKAYYANDTLSFESQLVNAVINTSGLLIGRLKVEFSGDATGGVGKETLNCRVSGRLLADPDQVFVHEQALQTVKIRNSPLWTVNPKQQLQYHATRAWARLYMPEVLLGIYTPDEVADGVAARIEAESTPRTSEAAPDRRDFENQPEDADYTPIETVLPESTPPAEEKSDAPAAEAENEAESGLDAAGDAEIDAADSLESDAEALRTIGNGVASEPQSADDAPIVDDVPVEPLEWAAWKTQTLADIAAVTDRDGFDVLRKRIDQALEQADDALLGEIQDALADKLTTLPEKAR